MRQRSIKSQIVEIDPSITYTKAQYGRAFGLNAKAVDKKVADKEIRAIDVQGTTLLIADRA